jgi:hypothetical protein
MKRREFLKIVLGLLGIVFLRRFMTFDGWRLMFDEQAKPAISYPGGIKKIQGQIIEQIAKWQG